MMKNKKEELLLTAIKNLMKAQNFLQMCLMLQEGQISQEDYNKQLKEKPDRYVIDIEYVKDKKDIEIIAEIIKELGPIGEGLSVNDVSEIFSFDGKQIVEFYQFNKD